MKGIDINKEQIITKIFVNSGNSKNSVPLFPIHDILFILKDQMYLKYNHQCFRFDRHINGAIHYYVFKQFEIDKNYNGTGFQIELVYYPVYSHVNEFKKIITKICNYTLHVFDYNHYFSYSQKDNEMFLKYNANLLYAVNTLRLYFLPKNELRKLLFTQI